LYFTIFCLIFSIFSDIFDEKRFISSLADDIKIIKKLPKELANAPKMVKQFKSWSGMDYYQNEIAALWDNFKVCNLFVYKFCCIVPQKCEWVKVPNRDTICEP